MNPGPLSLAARVLDVAPEQLEDALVATAANFLGSGGVVTLSEWSALPNEERRALYKAARIVALENAQTLAREIIRGQIEPASLLAPPEKAVE